MRTATLPSTLQNNTRPHPLVLAQRRAERRQNQGWLAAKVGNMVEDLRFFHAERPQHSTRTRLARRFGLAVCALALGSSAYGLSDMTRDGDHASAFRLDTTPTPVAAADSTRGESYPLEEEHDPTLYAGVDMASVADTITTTLGEGHQAIATAELGATGAVLLGAGGFLYRRRRQELQNTPVVEAATGQVAMLEGIFAAQAEPVQA